MTLHRDPPNWLIGSVAGMFVGFFLFCAWLIVRMSPDIALFLGGFLALMLASSVVGAAIFSRWWSP